MHIPPPGLLHILGHDIRQLQRYRDRPQDEVSILDGLVSKVLPDINFLAACRSAWRICAIQLTP